MAQFDADLDLVATTQRNFDPKDKWDDISLDMQDYPAMDQMFMKERIDIQSGTQNQWEIRVANEGNATMTQPYGTESTRLDNTMKNAVLPWRHVYGSYAIDERLLNANREPARLVNLMKVKEVGAKIDMTVLLEDEFWGKPADSSDNHMHGVQYHVVPNETQGFNGGVPSGFSDVYGLSPTTYTGLANYTGTYTSRGDAGLWDLVRDGLDLCNFKAPVKYPSYGGKSRRVIYTVRTNKKAGEKLLRQQNDDNGPDLDKYEGELRIRRIPIVWVPKLEHASWTGPSNPVYGIDWGFVKIAFMSGEVFKRLPPFRKHDSQRVIITPTYATCNINFWNRRRHFVFYKV